jgi:hypothetical protein
MRVALLSFPIAVAIAVWGAILGNWFVFGAMVLLELGQAMNYRACRRRLP